MEHNRFYVTLRYRHLLDRSAGPERAQALLDLGRALERKNRPEEALAQFQPAITTIVPMSISDWKMQTNMTVSLLQEEEIERLFSVIRSLRDRAISRVAYHAGLRASEVGKLELRDYDPIADRIYVRAGRTAGARQALNVRRESRLTALYFTLRYLPLRRAHSALHK